MFVALKKVTKKTKAGIKEYRYGQIVRSKRVNGKPTHEVVASLGRLPDDSEMALKLARTIIRHYRKERGDEQSEGVEFKAARVYGAIAVIRRVWKQLGLDKIVEAEAKKRKFGFSLEESLFAMVANRLLAPRSKLACADWLSREVFFATSKPLDADQFYHTLGWLESVQDAVELRLFRSKYPNPEEPVVTFWDTTTTWFEGRGPEDLVKFGRSKAGEPRGKRKILVGLARTREGWPITNQVFAGNTADPKTVEGILRRLRSLFDIKRCIWVTDRGMVSKGILALLEELGYEYVVATKLRGNKEVKNKVLTRPGRFRKVTQLPKPEVPGAARRRSEARENLEVKEVLVEDRRYVVCRNPKSVERDAARREDILQQLRLKLDEGDQVDSQHGRKLLVNRAYKRYLCKIGGRLHVSQAKVAKDARYDGKWVLRSNIESATAVDLALLYREETRIERDFRDIKSFYDLRPVRHFKEEHVKGHVFVCFLAKLIERELRGRMHCSGLFGTSVDAVLEELNRITAAQLILDDGRTQWVRSRLTDRQKDLLKRLDINTRHLPSLLPDYDPGTPRKLRLDNGSAENL